MTGDIGAHHNRSWSITVDIEKGRDIFLGKAKHIVYLQHIRPFFDTASICRLFWGEVDVMPEEYVKALILITGWNITTDEILKISEKIWNLNRIHLLLRNGGPGRKHDLPPARNFEEPIPDGPAKGKIIPREMVDRMLDEYYEARAWDNDGNPTEELLKDLGLSNTIDELKQNGLLGKPIPGGIPQVRGEVMKPRAM
jgi:aldehyde:ferredoxin oxidoreductase